MAGPLPICGRCQKFLVLGNEDRCASCQELHKIALLVSGPRFPTPYVNRAARALHRCYLDLLSEADEYFSGIHRGVLPAPVPGEPGSDLALPPAASGDKAPPLVTAPGQGKAAQGGSEREESKGDKDTPKKRESGRKKVKEKSRKEKSHKERKRRPDPEEGKESKESGQKEKKAKVEEKRSPSREAIPSAPSRPAESAGTVAPKEGELDGTTSLQAVKVEPEDSEDEDGEEEVPRESDRGRSKPPIARRGARSPSKSPSRGSAWRGSYSSLES